MSDYYCKANKKLKLSIIIVIFYVCGEMIQSCDCKYGYGRYNTYTRKNSYVGEYVKTKPDRAVGISAWGIIFLVVFLILFGIGSYYAGIFYPLLCKKERNYDRIELATV